MRFFTHFWAPGLLAVALLLGACAAPTAAPVTAPAAPVESAGDAFPVTIEHKYGSTTLDAAPTRIVTVGLTDHDALLALDIVPVGTSEWFGGYPGSVWPWAQHKLGEQMPEAVGGDAINFEKIAALQPDLILALFSGVTQEEYDLLAQIAPTVAQPTGYVDYGVPWQELTVTVGKVVGKQAAAAALVAEVEAKFAEVRAAHPEFEGATSVVATPYQGIWVYGPEDVRGRFLTLLGFTLPEGLAEITGAEFGGNLSMERADLLDVDVIIWLDPEDAEGELGGPVYQSLPVHTEGREVFLSSYNDPVGGATSFVSVLSLPFLLDELVPQLAAAIPAGTAATRTITDAAGNAVTLPVAPQRIVTLSEQDLDGALALGVKPAGSVNGRGQPALPAYLGERTQGITSVGSLAEPSLETIALLDPDVILVGGIFPALEELLPQLREIAPTVITYNLADDWKTAFRGTAAALNKEPEVEAFLADYDARVAALQEKLGEHAGATVSIARWMPDGPVIMAHDAFASLIVRDLGLVRPEAQQAIEGYAHSEPLSLEQLEQLDAGWLFIGVLNADGLSALQGALDNPLFQQLGAVKAGRVAEVDGTIWTSRGGPLATEIVLNDIAAAMVAP